MIEQSIDDGEAYRIVLDGKKVGGVVIKVEGEKGDLDLLFVAPSVHSKGIGYAAWCEVEKLHPEVKVWETVTPYFEQRNIHFYVNRCGFRIVEFFDKYHQDIFVIDVAEGDKIPRKGGPGITRSDLLVINKIDLAPYVGASLEIMERDSKKMRGDRPFQFTNIRGDENVDKVVEWIKKNVLLEGM